MRVVQNFAGVRLAVCHSTVWGYGDSGGHIGLSEVRFYEAPVATPLAGPLVLLASSLVGLVGVGRRA